MSASSKPYDAIIVGAGHNGLVCAGYLARAGYRVKVLERRGIVGGAAVTEEFYPGFRNSILSFVVGLLPPQIVRDLELEAYGLEIVERKVSSFQAYEDGRHMLLTMDKAHNIAEYARFSQHDAAMYPAYDEMLTEIADVIREITFETPPNLGGGFLEWLRAGRLARRFGRLSLERRRQLTELVTMSVGDFLDEWFESDAVKGTLGLTAVVGNFVSPYHPGSAIVLLHSIYGETNGVRGAFGHALGGMGAITQAMARFATSRGVEIEVDAPVAEVIVENGAARGVRLESGPELRARVVVSNLNPKLLFLKLIDRDALPEDFVRQMQGWRCKGGVFRMNLALSELPKFTCCPDLEPAAYTGMFKIAPSIEYLEHAYDDAKFGGWSAKPAIMWSVPSTLDDSLAPPGRHVAAVFAQHFHPQPGGGRTWDEAKLEAANTVIDTIDAQAPNFRSSILGMQVLSPLDLEREWGLLGGDIFHGQMHLDQMYSLRPAAGYADYRVPLDNLYVCGAGTHPGGSVTGMPGHNAAREIVRDLRRRKV